MIVLEAGEHYNRDNYPSDHLEAIAEPLPRRRPDDRRRPAADPGPGREGRRRHHGDQLRHLLPRPRRRCSRTGGSASASPGPRDLDADFAEAEEFLRVTQLDPERMGRNGQLAMEGAAAIGASGAPDLPQRRQLRPVQLLPLRLRDRRQARHARQLPAARGRRRGADPRRGRGAAGSWSRTAAPSASRCSAARRRTAGGRAFTVRARRAVIVAGGALGTPELLLRSGPRRRARSAATSTSTPPAGSAPATRRRCAAGTGVMQSYYVDQWEPAAGSCSRRPSRRSPSAAPGCSAPARDHQEAMLDFGHVGSIGVHLSDRSVGPGRPRRRRLAARQLQADRRATPTGSPSASPAPPKSTSPPAPPRSTPTSPASGC